MTTTVADANARNDLWSNWDKKRLVQMCVKREFVMKLNEQQASDFVKGILYLREKYKDLFGQT